MEKRDAARRQFIATSGWADAQVKPFAEDASFRRYFRLTRRDESVLLMDAPPELEPIAPFAKIAQHLSALGFSAPRIIARDDVGGWLLIEDFGVNTFTRLLAAGEDETNLYLAACDTLITLHQMSAAPAIELPRYDQTVLLHEAALLLDWHFPAVTGRAIDEPARASYLQAWRETLSALPAPAQSLVLRDYHVDNLMLLSERSGIQQCGLLDFQDALLGPCAYDLASLLEDARRSISSALSDMLYKRYVDAFPSRCGDSFKAWFKVLAAQRHAKVAGIFVRLHQRDAKPAYLQHIPRVVSYFAAHLRQPELAPVAQWICEHYPQYAQPVPAATQA